MSVPNSFAAVSSATGAQLDANFAACQQLNALNVLTKSGDQQDVSADVSLFRTGSWSLIASGSLYTLLGDFAMSYWSHNTAVDVNGNFLGRDDAGTCTFWAFTEGGLVKVYNAVTGGAGVVPVWTLVYTFNTATGNLTVAGNVTATGTVSGSNISSLTTISAATNLYNEQFLGGF